MATPRPCLAGTLVLLASCAGESAEQLARASFTRFQQALFGTDRTQLAQVLTRESRQAIEQLDFARLRTKRPLEVTAVRVRGASCFVEVRDPNRNHELATFVVVRQSGQWRVDLIASVGMGNTPGGRETRITPRQFSPQEAGAIDALWQQQGQ